MDVKLPYAISKYKDELIFISQRISKDDKYLCPFCNQELIPKKGQTRQHHFAHKVLSKCTPSPESILHKGAKLFLKDQLNRDENIKIIIDNLDSSPPIIDYLISLIGGSGLLIDSSRFPCKEYKCHSVEATIGKYIVDVVSRNLQSDESFAWEIFVTHKIEEDKEVFFKRNKIPFIELAPTFIPPNKYHYTVVKYDGFEIIDNNKHLLPYLYEANRVQLFEMYEENLTSDYISKLKRNLMIENKEEFKAYFVNKISPSSLYYKFREYMNLGQLGSKLLNCFEVDVSTHSDYEGEIVSTEQFEKADVVDSGKWDSIKINNHFFLPKESSFFSSLHEILTENGFKFYSQANAKNYINSIYIEIDSIFINKKYSFEINLSRRKDAIYKSEIESIHTKKRHKDGAFFCIAEVSNRPDQIFTNYKLFIIKLLNKLSKFFRIIVHVARHKEKKYLFVEKIAIKGVCNKEKVCNFLSNSCKDAYKDIYGGL